jgi:hypothetical protein
MNTSHYHPSIIKADTALKKFKVQLAKNSIPTSSSICMFLGEMYCELARALHTANTKSKGNLTLEMLHKDIILATDSTLSFLIRQIKRTVTQGNLRNIIHEAPQGKSMMVMAAELVLKESLALMVAFGATLGHGITPKDVFGGIESKFYKWQDQVDTRWHMRNERNEIRGLLDLTTIADLPGHYSCTISHLGKLDIPDKSPIMGTAPICSLVEPYDFWSYLTSMPDQLGWIHVPLTNVSKFVQPLFLVMQLIDTGVSLTSTTTRQFRDLSDFLRI